VRGATAHNRKIELEPVGGEKKELRTKQGHSHVQRSGPNPLDTGSFTSGEKAAEKRQNQRQGPALNQEREEVNNWNGLLREQR